MNKHMYSLIYRGLKRKDPWSIKTMATYNDSIESQILMYVVTLGLYVTALMTYYPLQWAGIVMPIGMNYHSFIAFFIIPYISGRFIGREFAKIALSSYLEDS